MALRSFLNLDFVRMAQVTGSNYPDERSKLDSLLTFSRASTATRINASGVLETVAANQPRFDFDPLTLAPRGLLIEEQRTNLCLRSQSFSASHWVAAGGASVTDNYAAAPDGTVSAARLSFSAPGGLYQYVAAPSTHGSVYIKGTAGQTVRLNGVSCVLNGGWQRFAAPGAVGGGSTYLSVSNSSATATEVLLWGAQMEVGTFATSYIPTAATAVTRSADLVDIPGLLPWYSATQGTWIVDAEPPSESTTTLFPAVGFNDATNEFVLGKSGGVARVYYYVSGAYQANILGAAWAGRQRLASTYAANRFAASFAGATPTVDTSGTVPTITSVKVGRLGGHYLNGHLARLSYQPYAVSDLLLKAMTQI